MIELAQAHNGRGKLSILAKIDLRLMEAFQLKWQKKIPPGSFVCHTDYPEITGKTIQGKGIYGIGYFNKWFEVQLDDPELASKTNSKLLIREGSKTGTWDLEKTKLANSAKGESASAQRFPKQNPSVKEDHVPVYFQKRK